MLKITMNVFNKISSQREEISWTIEETPMAYPTRWATTQADSEGDHLMLFDSYDKAFRWTLDQVIYCREEMDGYFIP